MQLHVTAESKLVLRFFSDVMPCSVVGIIKNHYGDNFKTFTSLRIFIEHFNWNTVHKHIKVFAEMHINLLHSYEIR